MVKPLGPFESYVASAKTYTDILAYLSLQPQLPPHLHYRIQYIYCRDELENSLLSIKDTHSAVSRINENLLIYNLTTSKSYAEDDKITFIVSSTSVQHLYTLSSLCYSSSWKTLLSKLVKNKYPKVLTFYWKQSDLTNALKALEQKLQKSFKLEVKELSIKEKRDKLHNGKPNSKRYYVDHYDSVREWTSKGISQVLDEALEREQWFKKIKFQLQKYFEDSGVYISVATCIISKFGSIHLNNYFPLLLSALSEELESPLDKSIKLYSNRGLKERHYKPANPITIEYQQDIFSKPESMKSFSTLIKGYPHSSKALYHSNPYFHASIADFKDSSSFDVFISNPQRLLIIPQIRTSVESLERFVSFLFCEFREGIVREMEWKEN